MLLRGQFSGSGEGGRTWGQGLAVRGEAKGGEGPSQFNVQLPDAGPPVGLAVEKTSRSTVGGSGENGTGPVTVEAVLIELR